MLDKLLFEIQRHKEPTVDQSRSYPTHEILISKSIISQRPFSLFSGTQEQIKQLLTLFLFKIYLSPSFFSTFFAYKLQTLHFYSLLTLKMHTFCL